jgi:hypothetical protein
MKHLTEIHRVYILIQPRGGIDFLHFRGPRVDHAVDLLLRITLAIEFVGKRVSNLILELIAASDARIRLVALVVLLELNLKWLDLR